MMKLIRWIPLMLLIALMSAALPTFAQEDEDMGDDMMTLDGLVNVGTSEDLGKVLVGPEGMTLYVFLNDTRFEESVCEGPCLENWPPLLIEDEAELVAGTGVFGDLGTITRSDDTTQVTYNGWPLYYWINDEAPGDATGQGVNDVWFTVEPALVGIGYNDALGSFLVGPNDMTLYLFAVDEQGAGTSACVDGCLANWPALTVADMDMEITAATGVPGEFTVFEREDNGEFQVAYNGWPLYYWINDEAPGDATGQGVNDVWFVIAPEIVVAGESEALGTILTGPDGFTVYTFGNDEPGVSNCTGGCLENWPPLLAFAEDQLVAGEGVDGELGSIPFDEAAGLVHVTYNGLPLYYWINDEAPGDTTGHLVNDVWFAVELGE